MTDQIELDSLVGEHVLDAVDSFSESVKQYGSHYEDCSIIRFRLDGKVYTAIEDPSDGYRSCLEKLFASPDEPVRNVFPPIRVIGRKKENDRWAVNDVLELVDATTGLIVLEVGTENTADYYPCFVGYFRPENMTTNATSSVGQGQDR